MYGRAYKSRDTPTIRPYCTSSEERKAFVDQYSSAIRAYLAKRWRGSRLSVHVEDAAQDIFVECFRDNGALSRVDPSYPGGFRPFLYGIIRNIARRVEMQAARNTLTSSHESTLHIGVESKDKCVSSEIDRRWALNVIHKALAKQEEYARSLGGVAARRVELLRLRFQRNLPIRRIAELWHEDAQRLHHEYARARTDYRKALRDVVAEQYASLTRRELENKCRALVELLG